MTSPLLALFARSLREDARARLTYFARAGLVGLVLLMGLVFAGYGRFGGWGGALGLRFFTTLMMLQTACITIAGLGWFTSAITEEKEEHTLGLLRMTNLSPLSILLGKSTSRLLAALLLLAAPLPFAALAMTLGGVSLGQIAAAWCALGAYTFFLCNLALLASVLARTTGGAGTLTALALAGYFGASSLVHGVRDVLATFGWIANSMSSPAEDALWSLTITARVGEVLSVKFAGGPVGVQVVSNLVLGVGCFLLAWALFAEFCDRAPAIAAARPMRRRAAGPRPVRPWRDAVAWKEFHFPTGGHPGLHIRAVLYGVLLMAGVLELVAMDFTQGSRAPHSWFVMAAGSFFALEVAVMAARIFRLEWREQTLAPIAMLPGSMRRLAKRKVRGCLVAAIPGAACVLTLTMPYLVLAMCLNPRADLYTPFFIERTIGTWVHGLFLWCLVAYVSLFVTRGALPLGFILAEVAERLVSVGAMMVTTYWTRFGPIQGIYCVTTLATFLLYLAASAVLIWRIPSKLEALAGEG